MFGTSSAPVSELPHYGIVLVRLGAALLLASVLAFRPWRWVITKLTPGSTDRRFAPLAPETAQAQALIGLAAAVVVAVIGDSVARAFGLVGLGGFIRFRSGLKDPRDAAVMFLTIGIGMGCGLGAIEIVAVATAFAALVLAGLDAFGTERPRHLVATYVLDRGDLGSVASPVDALRALTPGARALAVPSGSAATPKQDGGLLRLTFEVWLPQDVDAETLRMRAVQAGITGLVEVKLSEE
jgi:hypothetical protein